MEGSPCCAPPHENSRGEAILPSRIGKSDLRGQEQITWLQGGRSYCGTRRVVITRRDMDPMKPTARSRVSNGNSLLAGVDQHSATFRRYRDLVSLLVGEAYGGEATEAQIQLVRRAASISAWCEGQEAQMALGLDVDMTKYSTISNTLRRLLSDIGLTKVPEKPLTIDSYLAGTAR